MEPLLTFWYKNNKSYRYDLFHFPPQTRTFLQTDTYYRIHLPNLYCMVMTKCSVKFEHIGFQFCGKVDRLSSFNDSVFIAPLPHTCPDGAMCVSDKSICTYSLEEMYQEVFDSFFCNGGCAPAMPFDFSVDRFSIAKYMEDNTPGMWKEWPECSKSFFDLFRVGRKIDPLNIPKCNEILKRHAQEG